MTVLKFKHPSCKKLFMMFRWTRNNTLLMMKSAIKNNILSYTPKSSRFHFQPILFQFQCIVTTTDTYIRRFTKHKNKSFGILVRDNQTFTKDSITSELVLDTLENQITTVQQIMQKQTIETLTDCIGNFYQRIVNHEYLHQGELIVMFRESGFDLPERFVKAWHL